jgi:hypothetical protein
MLLSNNFFENFTAKSESQGKAAVLVPGGFILVVVVVVMEI